MGGIRNFQTVSEERFSEIRQRCIKSGPQLHSLGEWRSPSATAFLEGRGSALSPAPHVPLFTNVREGGFSEVHIQDPA
jgi:hypothetical protein